MKIGIIIGTRPEIIRMAPIIKELEKRNTPFSLIHTGQHYDDNMSRQFFKELELKEPDYAHKIKSDDSEEIFAEMIIYLKSIIRKETYNAIIVQGDTNSALAGALVAIKNQIPIIHIEAGNRCYDFRKPEEVNRILIDNISSLLFTQSEITKRFPLLENIPEKFVFNVGNTVVDTAMRYRRIAKEKSDRYKKNKLKDYVLVTLHRAETVDKKEHLTEFIQALKKISKEKPIIFTIHPRTKRRLNELSLFDEINTAENISTIGPISYFDFLALLDESILLLTDSGGALKEASAYKVPCVLYAETWPDHEGKDKFWKLSEYNQNRVFNLFKEMTTTEYSKKLTHLKCPFGEGDTAEKIVNITLDNLKKKSLNIPIRPITSTEL